jgi:signal transduction histidine kinase
MLPWYRLDMLDLGKWLAHQSRLRIGLFATCLVFVIAVPDYLATEDVSFSAVYVLPIAIAAWFVGFTLAYALAGLSVLVWLVGDVASGWEYSNLLIPVWNTAIRLLIYALVIHMVARIRSLTTDLELRILRRTSDLTREIAERERLERDLLDVAERERRRLGYDLHDGLCQHLTATALAVQVLKEKLQRQGVPEAREAERAVHLIEDGIALSHSLAKGLQPVDMQASGLMQALQDFTRWTAELFKISCRFECDSPVLVPDVSTANQLYRIVQEAASNAIKHGHACCIIISLDVDDEALMLRIRDDGVGIGPSSSPSGGLGLKIMAERAKLIGAEFSVRSDPGFGTLISCRLPQPADVPEAIGA